MSQSIDEAIARLYARRRKTAPSPTPEQPMAAPPAAGFQRTEDGPTSPPEPHVRIVEASPTRGPEVVGPEAEPTDLPALLCSVTDCIAATWLPDPIAVPSSNAPSSNAASGEASVSRENERTSIENGGTIEPPAKTSDVLDAPTIPSEPAAAPAAPASPLSEQEVLEGLRRAVDAVKQTDSRLRRIAEESQKFIPLWEVDQFQWPGALEALEKALGDELRGAAEGMLLASCRGARCLGLCGLRTDRGVSTLTLLLARALIGIGGKVAIVDAAATLAGLAEQCGIEAPCGWNEALMTAKPIEEAATLSLAEQSIILAWNAARTESLKDLPPEPVARAFRALRKTYDMTVVDLPSIDSGGIEALRRHPELCDALLIVRTPRDETTDVQEAVHAAREIGIRAVGMIDNDYAG